MATLGMGDPDGRGDDRRGVRGGAATAGTATTGAATTGAATACDRSPRRTRRPDAAATPARRACGDARARQADRVGHGAVAGSARRTEARVLGRRTGRLEPAHGVDDAVAREIPGRVQLRPRLHG